MLRFPFTGYIAILFKRSVICFMVTHDEDHKPKTFGHGVNLFFILQVFIYFRDHTRCKEWGEMEANDPLSQKEEEKKGNNMLLSRKGEKNIQSSHPSSLGFQ